MLTLDGFGTMWRMPLAFKAALHYDNIDAVKVLIQKAVQI